MKLWRGILQAINRRFTREAGSSTIELAIVLPVLVLLFAGATELGRLFYTYTTLAKATKVGARYLSTSFDATSTDATKVAAAKLAAQSLVVCGYTSCSGNQPDGTPKVPVVNGLSMSNPATNVAVTIGPPVTEGSVQVTYVTVKIQSYTYQPGPFNLAAWTGNANSKFYFGLTPATTMRYMLG
jgi:Flp pilus assembly protein TadG